MDKIKTYQLLTLCEKHIKDCLDELNNGTSKQKEMVFVKAKAEVIQDLLKMACSNDMYVFD